MAEKEMMETQQTSDDKQHEEGTKPSRPRGPRGHKGERSDRAERPKKDFEETLLEVRRVTRVTTGGRKLSFRAIILIGNKKGKIGLGIAKGQDVAIAVKKATQEAYKGLVTVPITESESVPYAISYKYKSARIKILPAANGTGLKAGSSLRAVLNLAGYVNILAKIMGTNNKLNNALACIMALAAYKKQVHKFTNKFKGFKEIVAQAMEGTEQSTEKKDEKEVAKKPTPKKK